MQPRFNDRNGHRPFRLLVHVRFRAAYDFLLLRAATGDADAALADWWTRFQQADETEQKRMARSPKRRSRKQRSMRANSHQEKQSNIQDKVS